MSKMKTQQNNYIQFLWLERETLQKMENRKLSDHQQAKDGEILNRQVDDALNRGSDLVAPFFCDGFELCLCRMYFSMRARFAPPD